MVNLPRSASLLDLFNANGAYQPSLGQRPREVEPSRVEALKARFIQPWCLGQADTRFQRLVAGVNSNSWGVAPGLREKSADGAKIAMSAITNSARVCETCGSPIDTTSAGDLGCIACLIGTGLDAEAEQSDTTFASAPDQLGAYTIEHHADGSAWELGHGAMGVTYRAIDKALDRPVALKIINTDRGSHSAEARERFMREARAAAALRHPNVATVYQFGVREQTGQFFYAMELVEGETLEERVRRLGPLDVLTTIDIALQVTAALEAAEERGLVHRDLKPGNLMLVSRNDKRAPSTATQRRGYNAPLL